MNTDSYFLDTTLAAKFFGDFGGDAASFVDRARLEADGSNTRMAAAAVALADRCEVVARLLGRPWVGADRHLGAKAGAHHGNGVDGVREQVIRDELVIALNAAVGEIEENHLAVGAAGIADDVDGFEMMTVERLEESAHFRFLHDLVEFMAAH